MRDQLLTDDAWSRAQAAKEHEVRMREILKKTEQTETEWKQFVNDKGEIRRMQFRIVRTKILRNPMLELRVLEQNREVEIFYFMLVGAGMCLFAIL